MRQKSETHLNATEMAIKRAEKKLSNLEKQSSVTRLKRNIAALVDDRRQRHIHPPSPLTQESDTPLEPDGGQQR
jgi:hypothetical protein